MFNKRCDDFRLQIFSAGVLYAGPKVPCVLWMVGSSLFVLLLPLDCLRNQNSFIYFVLMLRKYLFFPFFSLGDGIINNNKKNNK